MGEIYVVEDTGLKTNYFFKRYWEARYVEAVGECVERSK